MTEKVSRFKVALPSAGASSFGIGLRPRNAPTDGPQTLPGRLAEDTARGLQQQLDALRAEREDGRVILLLDPKDILITEFANRHAKSLAEDDPKMLELVESVRVNGQDQPVRVRPAANGSQSKYELVQGHRRLAACLHLDRTIPGGFQIRAILDAAASDARNLVLKMYRENEERFDLSAFEKGLMFQKWIDADLYKTAREIAGAIGMGEATVGKYLAIASLPQFLLDAFVDVREIPVRSASALSQLSGSANLPAIQKEALRIVRLEPRPVCDDVVKLLVGAASRSGKARKTVTTQETLVRIKGKVPLKVATKGNRISLKLSHLEPQTQKQFSDELREWAENWLRKRLDK
jgi:ParB family transcriptional regulator, chromosome partitioning protein